VRIVSKFLLTYKNPRGGGLEQSPEAQAKSMEAWNAWFGQIGSALVDGGNQIGQVKTVASNGSVSDGGTGANTGYSIIQVDSIDQAIKASQMCPVLAVGGSVEIGEILDMM
jgi:hypothetical protein